MSSSTPSAEQVAKVLEVLSARPEGAMIEKIKEKTGFTTETIYAALHVLEKEGTVTGRDAIGYGVDADKPTDTESDDLEKQRGSE